jgi:hypothetical protein
MFSHKISSMCRSTSCILYIIYSSGSHGFFTGARFQGSKLIHYLHDPENISFSMKIGNRKTECGFMYLFRDRKRFSYKQFLNGILLMWRNRVMYFRSYIICGKICSELLPMTMSDIENMVDIIKTFFHHRYYKVVM